MIADDKLRVRKPSYISLVIELALASIGLYFSYLSIGTPVSNANGNIIRSTVTSGWYPLLMMVGISAFSFDFSVRHATRMKNGLRNMLIASLAVAAAFSPLVVYFNFYYSYSANIGGVEYTIYPYGVQPAIPFMISLFVALIAGLQIIAYGPMEGKEGYTASESQADRKKSQISMIGLKEDSYGRRDRPSYISLNISS